MDWFGINPFLVADCGVFEGMWQPCNSAHFDSFLYNIKFYDTRTWVNIWSDNNIKWSTPNCYWPWGQYTNCVGCHLLELRARNPVGHYGYWCCCIENLKVVCMCWYFGLFVQIYMLIYFLRSKCFNVWTISIECCFLKCNFSTLFILSLISQYTQRF